MSTGTNDHDRHYHERPEERRTPSRPESGNRYSQHDGRGNPAPPRSSTRRESRADMRNGSPDQRRSGTGSRSQRGNGDRGPRNGAFNQRGGAMQPRPGEGRTANRSYEAGAARRDGTRMRESGAMPPRRADAMGRQSQYRDDVNRSHRTARSQHEPPHSNARATQYRSDYRQDRNRTARRNGNRPAQQQVRAANVRMQQGRRPDFASTTADALGGFFSPRSIQIVIALVVVLAIVLLLVKCVPTHRETAEAKPVERVEQQTASRVNACILSEDEIVSALEQQGVSEEWAKQAAQNAQTDRRFMMMALKSNALGKEGAEVTDKLVKLADKDPEAVQYVVDFIDRYPQEGAQPIGDQEVSKGTVPQFYQWDERWGYTTYSGAAFGLTGCGPTSMAMVYAGITGNTDMSPSDMAKAATENGYETDYDGTVNEFFTVEAYNLGLAVYELDISSDALANALNSGMVVICNVGPGDFTTTGHFFVIRSLNDDGTVNINDPYSSVNSSQAWDIDTILGQTVALFAYSAGDASSETGGN